MSDDLSRPERMSVRTPMDWDEVARQRRDRGALLNRLTTAVHARREMPEFGKASWEALDVGAPSVLAVRSTERDRCAIALNNLSSEPRQAKLDADGAYDVLADRPLRRAVERLGRARRLRLPLAAGAGVALTRSRRGRTRVGASARMRVLLWHGWLLDGTGSNVYTARVAEVLAADGHDVVVVCQEHRIERHPWVDAVGTVSASGVSTLEPTGGGTGVGRGVILRPDIGSLLPVFVLDEYEGFEAKRFVDLSDEELERYLTANVGALRVAVDRHGSDVVIAGHAVPGGAIASRALGPGRYVVKIHGSDVEYAMRPQERYRELAREGLGDAIAVTGSSHDVLDRCASLVPGIAGRSKVVHPGVDAVRFSPRQRRAALLDAAARLDADPTTARGRRKAIDVEVERASATREVDVLDALAHAYEQTVPDVDAAARLRSLAAGDEPIVGYLGKLIPQKGVALLLAALTRTATAPTALIVGFGSERERLQALTAALRSGDAARLEWVLAAAGWDIDATELGRLPLRSEVAFTGRLDHSYAPDAVAAMDVLVVPSVLEEAFGMVAAEGAAAGALLLVARHSGLAEVADALEGHVGRPRLFSFEPGRGAVRRIAEGIDRLLSLEPDEREALRGAIRGFVSSEWSWRRTAERLLGAARAG